MGQSSTKSEPRTVTTVLVIDDSNFVLESTRSALESAGYRVITRNRPSGSITAILNEKPDIVLLDLNMPMLSGEAILKILTSAPNPNRTMVLLHSGLPTEALRGKALKTGAHGYVQKTDNSAEFLRRVEYWLKRQKQVSSAKLRLSAEVMQELPARNDFAVSTLPPPRAATTLPVTTSSTLPPPRDARTLPVVSRPAPPLQTLPSFSTVHFRVLFVDDDVSMLKSYRTTIGSSVDAAYVASGEEALALMLGEMPPDIVVCDVLMPAMTGADLYRRAVAMDPSWSRRFLFVTAAATMASVAEFLNEVDSKVFFKPLAGERLLEGIHKLHGVLER